MNVISKPNIFIISDIQKIFNSTVEDLETIEQDLKSMTYISSWILKSTYVHIYSIFEATLYQTYYKILLAFPDTIKNIKIDNIGDMVSSHSLMTPLVEMVASTFARGFAYGGINDILNNYNKIVQIGLNTIDDQIKTELEKYKNERNLLVHQGMLLNNLNKDVISKRIKLIKNTLKEINKKFESKYCKYTKQDLIKNSWSYVFEHALPFDSCFILNEDGNSYRVNTDFIDKRVGTLSSSEKMLIVLFLANYNSGVLDYSMRIKDLCMFANLTQHTKNKIGFILELFHKYPALLQ